MGLPSLDWLDSVSASDIMAWHAYYEAEPWGGERDDMRAEVSRVRSLGGDLDAVEPFYPYVREPEKTESVAEQSVKLEALAAKMRRERGLK